MRRVLVTGAEGLIGGIVRRELGERYDLVSLTATPQDWPSHVGDIAELRAIEPAFAGVDSVVHLAASAAVDTPWDDVLQNNLLGTYNVFEAARRAGVQRIVFASSNHTVGMYEVEGAPAIYRPDDARVVDHAAELRPDSLYGVSKAFGEALGRLFADVHGLAVFCLRIGFVIPDDDPRDERSRAVWLSHRDCASLIGRCLQVEGVPFAIVYGVSANAGRFWDLAHAREVLGWEPQDGAP